jgi:hypothetical protein
VRTLMDQAQAAGLNTMRTWVHPVNAQYALQTAPGKYNEAVFRGLDYVLAEAQKRGIKVGGGMTWDGEGLRVVGCSASCALAPLCWHCGMHANLTGLEPLACCSELVGPGSGEVPPSANGKWSWE